MTLLALFQTFLREPNTAVLADNASINYIPTLTTVNEPTAIIRHLQAQGRQLRKTAEKALDAVEGANALYLETETTLEFLTGGGAYLPGLDDNFVADKIVTFPLSYVVRVDEQGKIQQIRVYWDQGSLLKQLDVIGARARNWPIRDGKDQVRLISFNSPATLEHESGASSRRTTTSEASGRSHASSTTSVTGDRQSLSLFAPIQHDEDAAHSRGSSVVSPRASAKPPARNLTDILGGGEDAPSPSPTIRNVSPKKAGAGKNYHPVRLFDENEDEVVKDIKTNPKKYNHFEFGQGEDVPADDAAHVAAAQEKRKKHASQWDFADFVTPDKVNPKVRPVDTRHFGWSDDEDADTSPIKRPVVHHERPNTKPQFEFVDDSTPIAERKQAPAPQKGTAHNNGLSLYKDHIIGDDDAEDATLVKKPLATVTNISNQDRRKYFDSSFEMTDASPSAKGRDVDGESKENGGPGKALTEGQKKTLNVLNASWDMYDDSPDAASKKENMPEQRGIKTHGNGMGAKSSTQRHWGFGDDVEQEEEKNFSGERLGSKRTEAKSFWDF